MTQPLALVLFERLLPGTQLVNRLQDLKYRVQTISDASKLTESAEEFKPMLVLADVETGRADILGAIKRLRQNQATSHLPVIAFGEQASDKLQAEARDSGATLLVAEATILTHLPQFLEQALQLD